MAPKSKTNALKRCRKTEAGNDPKMEPNRRPNGAKMDPKGDPKSDVFFDGFPDAFGNIDGTAGGPRVSLECAARVTLSAADPQGRRHIIKEYRTKTNKDGIACGIWHALGRWPGDI